MEKIRVACGNRGVGTAPLFAAVEGGYFKEQGLDPELLYYQGHPNARPGLRRREDLRGKRWGVLAHGDAAPARS
ncbi:MAG TPA: hypothetical protein VGV13_14130 [Methylomirabilota bacterium]|jgi:ABC-type nitrate/sulfonate/bicarbonate transport system substrate-binding protein|nr:hypothetical protein [Methylomirabilota bacterium]